MFRTSSRLIANARIFDTMARHQRARIKHVNMLLDPNEVKAVLLSLCIKLGFCLPPAEIERMAASPPRNMDEFSRAVFIAEGLDPVTADKRLFAQVRELVAKAFVEHQSTTDQQ